MTLNDTDSNYIQLEVIKAAEMALRRRVQLRGRSEGEAHNDGLREARGPLWVLNTE